MLDDERCYRAVQSRDVRFDGWFFTAVVTTGIYCRPSCPAVTPKRPNVRFFPTAAAAHGAGFRACKRCRPDATPGSPQWDARADVVARAMRMVADGVVDRGGVPALAARLGYSERQLQRLLVAEVGAGALSLARAQRAQTARLLLETTDVPIADVAFAAGFASVRQFNDTVRAVFAVTPTELRAARRGTATATATATAGTIALRLPYRAPIDLEHLFAFLARRAVPGIEDGGAQRYRRTLRLPNGGAIVELTPGDGHVRCALRLDDLRDLNVAVHRVRRLLDLDADPHAVHELLGSDAHLGPLVLARPGLRSPGHVDPAELAVRAVLGQQVSVAGARTTAAKLVGLAGEPLGVPDGALTHRFPTPEALASLDPAVLPVPRARGRAVVALSAALASGAIDLDPGADREGATEALQRLPGIGPWTASYVRLRALGDPDVFLPTDLGVRHALTAIGADGDDVRWRPWRSYALHHLWAATSHPTVNAA